MTGAPWKALLAIAFGSVAGALLRQATIFLLVVSGASASRLAFAVSGIGGALLGALLGWTETTAAIAEAWRLVAMITLVATLATFAAAAVLSAPFSSYPDEAERMLYVAALHIATAILTAAIGLGIVWRLSLR